eukprot:COSAG05_NODE_16472_length_345_cov_0.837398_1_plen_23_part_10
MLAMIQLHNASKAKPKPAKTALG